jgi:predicted transcriptional regulator
MKELTKAEEEIMQILWRLRKARVADVLYEIEDKDPSYNTVSTIVRILQSKGFVDHEKHGRGYLYFPIIEKEAYQSTRVHCIVNDYFNGSFKNMLSFFVQKEDLDIDDLEEIKQLTKNKEG